MREQQTGKDLEGREHKHIYGLPQNLARKIKENHNKK
jgi:hypothetical protein